MSGGVPPQFPWLDLNELSRQSTTKVSIARQSRDPKGIFQLCGYRMGITAYPTESGDDWAYARGGQFQ